jgi:hypothetical protein
MKKLYNLYRNLNGKTMLMMTDSLDKVKKRQTTLRSSYRGCNVDIYYEPAEEDDAIFKKKPHGMWNNYNARPEPKRSK